MLYGLQDRQDHEVSPDVVIAMLLVIDLDVYSLLDPGDTLSSVTCYLAD